LQFKHLRRLLGGFIGSKLKRNHYRKTQRTAGRKSSRNKTQTGEEGRRVFSKPFEENSTEEDPIPDRQFCIHSILTVATTLAGGEPKSRQIGLRTGKNSQMAVEVSHLALVTLERQHRQ
jgi:hypothetical protein